MDMRKVKVKKVVIGLEVKNMRYWRGRRSFEKLEGKEEFEKLGVWGGALRKCKGKKRRSIE